MIYWNWIHPSYDFVDGGHALTKRDMSDDIVKS